MKNIALAFLLFTAAAWSQTLSFSNAGSPPTAGYAPGSVVTLNITKSGNPTDAAIQFNLPVPPGVASISVAASPAATAAGKTVTCGATAADICVLVGFNANTIPDGVVAIATVTLASSVPQNPVAVSLTNPIEGDTNGSSLPVTIQNPTVSLSIKNACDVDGDGSVSSADLSSVVSMTVTGATSTATDLNSDGATNVLDAQIVATAGTPPGFVCNAK